MSELSALLVGESWVSLRFDIKGFDIFPRSVYYEAIDPLERALTGGRVETTYVPTGAAATDVPFTTEELAAYDVVVLSDVGYNTLALPPKTFDDFERLPNRLRLLDAFVRDGGGLLMIGGYLSFTGFNGRAAYKDTPVETALPVTMLPYDDRVERSEGVSPICPSSSHPVVATLPEEWPPLLGYNRVIVDDEATELVRVEQDPLLVVGEHGAGRSAAFASDCAPHWGAPTFTGWEHYDDLWTRLLGWLAGK